MAEKEAPLSDGSWVSGRTWAVDQTVAIDRQMRADEREWVAALRKAGVKAAHPDDGWVDRAANSVQFVYPQFNDGPKEGDIIALGWPWKHRLVRVTRVEPRRGMFTIGPTPVHYHFDA